MGGLTRGGLPTTISRLKQWVRYASAQALAAPCQGFEGLVIDSRQILVLLQEAARQGEPDARARMLLFRDIAAPKDEAVARDEDPQRMALAQRLRGGLVSALRRQDWNWLGFGADAVIVADSGGMK